MIAELQAVEYNPRTFSEKEKQDLTASIDRFSLADPIIINRNNRVIGGHFRLNILKERGIQDVDVRVPDRELGLEEEKELNLRLNKNTGSWDLNALADFDEELLIVVGFPSEELDGIFNNELYPEIFDLEAELKKIGIENIGVKKGDIWQLGTHRMMCGDSTNEGDVLKLMAGEKADMCFTDPPYILDYLHTKYKGKGPGFGYKCNRKYLETDSIPPDFTEKWMANIAKIQKKDFSIIVYENWKNIRAIWGEMEKHWKIKNMIVWHLPNRHQGFTANYRFFSKHDIAMVGTGADSDIAFNTEAEEEGLQNEYETALFAVCGHPQWEKYASGKKFAPTDHIACHASTRESHGDGIVFGTKPLEILIPYIKVLTRRDALIIEPFGGSGSTLIAAEKMKRRCYLIEKVPTYAEIIKRRWEKLTGQRAELVNV